MRTSRIRALVCILFLCVLISCGEEPEKPKPPKETGPLAFLVEMTDRNAFLPPTVELEGRLLVLTNRGALVHNFTIEAVGIDYDVQPGADLAVPLEEGEGGAPKVQPGNYDFYCKYHVDMGMNGTLIVS